MEEKSLKFLQKNWKRNLLIKISEIILSTLPTYKIISNKYKQYKMISITGVDSETNISYLTALIIIKFEDTKSFEMIFKFLNTFYKFNPEVIHIDYSKALRTALLKDNLFQTKSIIIHCFFHFVQAIVKNMKLNKLFKTKMSKRTFELLKNIKIVCFIPPTYINTFTKFLENNLIDNNEKIFMKYFKKNWIIEYIYLPTKKCSNINFLIAIRNIIKNSELKKSDIIRKDYVTRTLFE